MDEGLLKTTLQYALQYQNPEGSETPAKPMEPEKEEFLREALQEFQRQNPRVERVAENIILFIVNIIFRTEPLEETLKRLELHKTGATIIDAYVNELHPEVPGIKNYYERRKLSEIDLKKLSEENIELLKESTEKTKVDLPNPILFTQEFDYLRNFLWHDISEEQWTNLYDQIDRLEYIACEVGVREIAVPQRICVLLTILARGPTNESDWCFIEPKSEIEYKCRIAIFNIIRDLTQHHIEAAKSFFDSDAHLVITAAAMRLHTLTVAGEEKELTIKDTLAETLRCSALGALCTLVRTTDENWQRFSRLKGLEALQLSLIRMKDEKNIRRSAQRISVLLSFIGGEYGWLPEESTLVVNLMKDVVQRLSQEFVSHTKDALTELIKAPGLSDDDTSSIKKMISDLNERYPAEEN